MLRILFVFDKLVGMVHRGYGYPDLMGDAYYIIHFRPTTYNCSPNKEQKL